ncbi:MAG: sulfotransferase [Solirubrobacterales bacterium]|nr:sulfotransferase [Solirubrobacterales bacterium]
MTAAIEFERPEHPQLLFIGGTGRSGTHVFSQLLANHSRYARVPIEARFHVNPQGFPDLLAGEVSADQFVRKLERFWWKRIRAGEVAPVLARRIAFGHQVHGLARSSSVTASTPPSPSSSVPRAWTSTLACRNLFLDLLWPIAEEAGKPGLIEMSCFTVAESPTLVRLFPEAKILHTVRDGRDMAPPRSPSARSAATLWLGEAALVGGPPAQDRSRASASCRPGSCTP